MAKRLWIQDAVKHPGALRETAKRMGLIEGGQKLTAAAITKLAQSDNPKTAARARLAETFRKMRKHKVIPNHSLDKEY